MARRAAGPACVSPSGGLRAVAREQPFPASVVSSIALCLLLAALAVPLVLGFHLTRTVLSNILVGPMHRAAVRMGLL